MTAKTRAARLARLERLEEAVAELPTPKSERLLPALWAVMFQALVEQHAQPGVLLPSARALQSGFGAWCSALPESKDSDVDLADPALALLVAAVREELTAFLAAHLRTDRGHWNRSTAWMAMGDAGFPNPFLGAPERGPTAEQWCARLSDLEVLFEAMNCLMQAAIRVERWWEMRESTDEAVREAVRLPAEEEAALLAEIGVLARSDPRAVPPGLP